MKVWGCDMRGWFIADNGTRFVLRAIESIVPYSEGASVWMKSGRCALLALDELARLIAQIEAENSDSIAVKEQMFHHAGGAFLLSDVRGYKAWKATPEKHGVPAIDGYINVHIGGGDSSWHTSIEGSDIPRFLAAMGVPNEPT